MSPGVREALPRPCHLRRLQCRMSQRRLQVLGLPRQTDDANLPAFIELLQSKGFDWDFIQKRLRTFVGLKVPALKSPSDRKRLKRRKPNEQDHRSGRDD